MASYTAKIGWTRKPDEVFTDNRYSRGHQWSFDGGVTFRASASPHVVPRFSDPSGVDPEEAFIASLSSCHMLWFLSIAAAKGYVVDSYADEAVGAMTKNPQGKYWMSVVTLRPKIIFGGPKLPDRAALDAMHHAAHEECYIANSVRTEVRCEPVA